MRFSGFLESPLRGFPYIGSCRREVALEKRQQRDRGSNTNNQVLRGYASALVKDVAVRELCINPFVGKRSLYRIAIPVRERLGKLQTYFYGTSEVSGV